MQFASQKRRKSHAIHFQVFFSTLDLRLKKRISDLRQIKKSKRLTDIPVSNEQICPQKIQSKRKCSLDTVFVGHGGGGVHKLVLCPHTHPFIPGPGGRTPSTAMVLAHVKRVDVSPMAEQGPASSQLLESKRSWDSQCCIRVAGRPPKGAPDQCMAEK